MDAKRTKWSIILTAISTYGGGFAVGSSCVSRLKIRPNKRRRNFFFHKKKQIQTTSIATKETENYTPSVPCRNFDNGNGICPFGDKCFFSHAIIAQFRPKTIETEPIVDAEIFFKSLPKNAMTPQSMRTFAEQFGVVTKVTFLPENAKAPGRIAGRINMENEKAARCFEDALDNKMFKVENQRVYVRAAIQKINKNVQRTCTVIKSHIPPLPKKEEVPTDVFPVVPRSNGKQKMTPENLRSFHQIADDSRLAAMMQIQEEMLYKECATTKIYQLSQAKWPALPFTPSAKTMSTPSTKSVASSTSTKQEVNTEQWTTIKNGKRIVISEVLPIHLPSDVPTSAISDDTEEEMDASVCVVPMAITPHTPKKLLQLDWVEFDRERLKERHQTKSWSMSPTHQTDMILFDDAKVVKSTEGTQADDSDDNDDDEEDDDDNAYDEGYDMTSLVKLLPARLQKRYL